MDLHLRNVKHLPAAQFKFVHAHTDFPLPSCHIDWCRHVFVLASPRRVTSQRRSCHLQPRQRSSRLLRWLLSSSLSKRPLPRSVQAHTAWHSGTVTQLRLKAINGFQRKRSETLLKCVCVAKTLHFLPLFQNPMTVHFLTGPKGATSEGKSFPESPCHTSAAETNRGWARCQAEQPSCSITTKWAFEPWAVLKLSHSLDSLDYPYLLTKSLFDCRCPWKLAVLTTPSSVSYHCVVIHLSAGCPYVTLFWRDTVCHTVSRQQLPA